MLLFFVVEFFFLLYFRNTSWKFDERANEAVTKIKEDPTLSTPKLLVEWTHRFKMIV